MFGTNCNMNRLTYGEVEKIMCDFNKAHGYTSKGNEEEMVAVAVASQSNFKREYTLEERSYRFSSDNKAFLPETCSNSIFADALSGDDDGVRLDLTEWKIDYYYLVGKEAR